LIEQKDALQAGRVTVRNAVISESYIFQEGDWMNHQTHRHEPIARYTRAMYCIRSDRIVCVICLFSAEAIQIIEEADEIVVINKPGSFVV